MFEVVGIRWLDMHCSQRVFERLAYSLLLKLAESVSSHRLTALKLILS